MDLEPSLSNPPRSWIPEPSSIHLDQGPWILEPKKNLKKKY